MDDDAHKVVVCSHGLLLLKHIDLNENNENDFKDIKVVHKGGQDSCC